MRKVQFRVLYREFLLRLFDVEMLSAHARGDAGALWSQCATLLICLSILFAVLALAFDGKISGPLFLLGSWSAQHFLIATTMAVVGLFAVLNWNAIFPEKRDILVLAPLPVRSGTIFMAKIAAVGTALAIAVLALHILAGMVWPFAFNKSMPAQSVPALMFDRPIPPVSAADLHSVLDRDIAPMLRNGGGLAPGTGGGVVIGVYRQGVRQVITYGTASPNSIFEIGSLTKTFTGLLLAEMVEQKKVTFEEPVRFLLPENTAAKPSGSEIRLLDLATHHSGLPGMPNNLPPGDVAHQFIDYHVPDLYSYLSSHGVQLPKNASFAYSNFGFSVLGQALANRAGVSYRELLRQDITAPLGLHNTIIKLSPAQETRFIQGHNEKHEAVPPWDLDAFVSAGGIRSTAGDMLTYLAANLHPGKLASTDATLAAALRESHQLRADVSPGTRIALAWFYDPANETYSHAGATGGYSSYAFFNPRGDYAGIVLLNNGPSFSSDCGLMGEHIRQRLTGEPAFSLSNIRIPANGGFAGLIRSVVVYWITMFAAAVFIFCCVLTLQGLAAQLPRRYFLRVSSFLQAAVFCLLIGVYFLQPGATPMSLIEAQGNGLLAWSPSFWFLGLYQQLSGSPALTSLAHRAWAGLAIAIGGTALAYTLSYFRTLRKIIEEPDILPGAHGLQWLPRFGDSLETAVVQFSIRTLFRSRQHRLFLAFYAGIAFAIASYLLKSPSARGLSDVTISDPWRQVSMPLLASTILIMALSVVGLRVVFSLPMNLGANWIFRVTPVQSGSQCLSAYRRSLRLLAVAPVLLASAALLLSVWPWPAALSHLAILGFFGTALVEFCLAGNQKIPFACSWLPGKSNMHITVVLCANVALVVLAGTANLERAALQDPTHTCIAILIVASVAAFSRWRNWLLTRSENPPLRFEESPSWQLVTLNLPRDGGLPTP